MTISLNSILDFEFYEGHLWAVKFEGSNIMNSGGEVGNVFPASNVSETIFEVQYDSLTVGNGFTIKVPQAVSYLGELQITFYEGENGEPMQIERFLKNWVTQIHTGNRFKPYTAMVKRVEVYKYKRDGGSSKVSEYLVLPPASLVYSPSGSVDAYTNQINLPIIQANKIHD